MDDGRAGVVIVAGRLASEAQSFLLRTSAEAVLVGFFANRPKGLPVLGGHPPAEAEVTGVADDRFGAQHPMLSRVGPAGCPADPPSGPYVPLIATYGSSKLHLSCFLRVFELCGLESEMVIL